MRLASLVLAAVLPIAFVSAKDPKPKSASKSLRAPDNGLLDTVRASTLKGHVSFLAADALEGRDTPSKGLDVAAEYIASQFRRFGLEPAGNDGYFQTAHYAMVTPKREGLSFTLTTGGQTITAASDKLSADATEALDLTSAPLIKVMLAGATPLDGAALKGKVVIYDMPDLRGMSADDRSKAMPAVMRDREILRASGAALLVPAGPQARMGGGGSGRARLTDLEDKLPPSITVTDEALAKTIRELPTGAVNGTAAAKIPAPEIEKVTLKNVAGLVRGSDPALKDTYILLTAHYDHVGVRGSGADRIFNGANDDASGTAAVLNLAEAFASATVKPKRSILFLTVFGEEKGLLGSRYYARHPLVPLVQTVADMNLEQVGRTDDTEGPQIKRFAVTGMDYSTVGDVLKAAGKQTGVTVFRHEKNSDRYFSASDNQALADVGIPAHTISVAYEFPDYHGAGDHWDKLDYTNMELVTRTVALAVWMMGNDPRAPVWHADVPKAKPYVEAAKKLATEHPQAAGLR